MTEPCTQHDNIAKIGETVERIHDVVTDLALQNQRIGSLETMSVDHEGRIRRIEKTPLRVLYWVAGIVATVIGGFFTHKLW